MVAGHISAWSGIGWGFAGDGGQWLLLLCFGEDGLVGGILVSKGAGDSLVRDSIVGLKERTAPHYQ